MASPAAAHALVFFLPATRSLARVLGSESELSSVQPCVRERRETREGERENEQAGSSNARKALHAPSQTLLLPSRAVRPSVHPSSPSVLATANARGRGLQVTGNWAYVWAGPRPQSGAGGGLARNGPGLGRGAQGGCCGRRPNPHQIGPKPKVKSPFPRFHPSTSPHHCDSTGPEISFTCGLSHHALCDVRLFFDVSEHPPKGPPSGSVLW